MSGSQREGWEVDVGHAIDALPLMRDSTLKSYSMWASSDRSQERGGYASSEARHQSHTLRHGTGTINVRYLTSIGGKGDIRHAGADRDRNTSKAAREICRRGMSRVAGRQGRIAKLRT